MLAHALEAIEDFHKKYKEAEQLKGIERWIARQQKVNKTKGKAKEQEIGIKRRDFQYPEGDERHNPTRLPPSQRNTAIGEWWIKHRMWKERRNMYTYEINEVIRNPEKYTKESDIEGESEDLNPPE